MIPEAYEAEFAGRYGSVIRERAKSAGYIPNDLYITAHKLATKLRFVREKYAGGLDIEGDTIDLQAYINWKVGGMKDEPEIFETEVLRHRASMIILFDMSSSMVSERTYYMARRVSTILSLAASMVKGLSMKVFEFGSNTQGDTKVVISDNPREVMAMRPDPNYYLTPIHVALMVARNELMHMDGARMIVLVSDGVPCFNIQGKDVPYERLREWVFEERKKIESRGIELFSVLTRPELKEKDLIKMYGPRGRWVVVDYVNEISSVLVRRFVEKVSEVFRKSKG